MSMCFVGIDLFWEKYLIYLVMLELFVSSIMNRKWDICYCVVSYWNIINIVVEGEFLY